MFDTILIGTSGLLSHAKGLRTVGNNLANVNTPGFKGAQTQFANLIDQGSADSHGAADAGDSAAEGTGLTTLGSRISFRAGLDQTTGNPLDLSINGNGFFTLKRGDSLVYTRAGDFRFDEKGVLVNGAGDHVQGLDSAGRIGDISVDGLRQSLPKATGTVKLSGNVSSTVAVPAVDASVSGMTVYDASGTNHPLTVTLHNTGSGAYTVTTTDAAGTVVNTSTLTFSGGFPTSASALISFNYTPAGGSAQAIQLDFSATYSQTDASSLAVASQDGYQAGIKTDQTIEADGTVTIHYSNGQTAKGPRIAMANFTTAEDLEQLSGSAFSLKQGASVQYGYANSDHYGKLAAGHLEGSNVDMAEEFSNLILMQRGYQASSHVVSTANDMIQELFDMKGHR